MDLLIEKNAAKALARMQPKTASAILQALRLIANEPFTTHANVKRLRGDADYFRLRHGDWRALYRIDRNARQVIVEAILPRGSAYR